MESAAKFFNKLTRKLNVLELYIKGIFSTLPPKGDFPFVENALKDPNGLLMVGGKLTPESIVDSMKKGIFPYYYKKPVRWWSPDPRMALIPKDLKVQQGLRRVVKKDKYRVTFDTAFSEVMEGCADRETTWINNDIIESWSVLFDRGLAHSVEVWNNNGKLVGGLYGIALGKFFSTESLFFTETNASKVAFMYLNCHLQHWGFELNDLQFVTEHWKRQGCTAFSRKEYVNKLQKAVAEKGKPGPWYVDENLNVAKWKPKEPGSQLAEG